MIFARALVRVLSVLLPLALAIAGFAVALFSIAGGPTGLSHIRLARLLDLASLRRSTDHFLHRTESAGDVAWLAALAGIVIAALGALLLAGALLRRRERLLTLAHDGSGRITARGRALSGLALALVEPVDGVTRARVAARSRRGRTPRLRVYLSYSQEADPNEVSSEAARRLEPLTDSFDLDARVSARLDRRFAGDGQ